MTPTNRLFAKNSLMHNNRDSGNCSLERNHFSIFATLLNAQRNSNDHYSKRKTSSPLKQRHLHNPKSLRYVLNSDRLSLAQSKIKRNRKIRREKSIQRKLKDIASCLSEKENVALDQSADISTPLTFRSIFAT